MSKKLWFKCLKSMMFATLASLGALVVCALVVAATLNSIKNEMIKDLAIKAIITYDDKQQSSATIQVINGADNSELMSDALTLGGNKIGAYYLQLGKGNIRDSLVSWHYEYLEDGKLYFYYSVFSFEADGNITYSARGGDTFNVSNKSSAIRGNEKFLVMIKKLRDNIDASSSAYNGYLLLDNQGDSMLISTADNMLTPTELTFELEDFVIESEGE